MIFEKQAAIIPFENYNQKLQSVINNAEMQTIVFSKVHDSNFSDGIKHLLPLRRLLSDVATKNKNENVTNTI